MSWSVRIVLAISTLLALAACGKSSRPREPELSAASTASASAANDLRAVAPALQAPSAPPQSALDGPEGLYVPSGGSAQRLPLLVFLHGLGGSGQDLREQLRLVELAESRGFVLLTPEGPLDFAGRRYWNATGSCCDFDRKGLDHVGELRDWIQHAVRNPRVDPRRVYLIGFSNGGFLAHRAGCELAPLLHGIVSIAGAAPGKGERCEPAAPLNVLQIHGTADPIVAFDGGYLFANTRYPRHPSVDETLARWAKLEHCSEQRKPGGTLDLDPRIAGGETEITAYEGCRGGRVELWKVVGGNHVSGLSRASISAIWDYIESLEPKPE
jgi:polyhydroxybutyrate depolymerase